MQKYFILIFLTLLKKNYSPSDYGQDADCPNGFVAVGACGSGHDFLYLHIYNIYHNIHVHHNVYHNIKYSIIFSTVPQITVKTPIVPMVSLP